MPKDPQITASSSDRMSPNIFSVTRHRTDWGLEPIAWLHCPHTCERVRWRNQAWLRIRLRLFSKGRMFPVHWPCRQSKSAHFLGGCFHCNLGDSFNFPCFVNHCIYGPLFAIFQGLGTFRLSEINTTSQFPYTENINSVGDGIIAQRERSASSG